MRPRKWSEGFVTSPEAVLLVKRPHDWSGTLIPFWRSHDSLLMVFNSLKLTRRRHYWFGPDSYLFGLNLWNHY